MKTHISKKSIRLEILFLFGIFTILLMASTPGSAVSDVIVDYTYLSIFGVENDGDSGDDSSSCTIPWETCGKGEFRIFHPGGSSYDVTDLASPDTKTWGINDAGNGKRTSDAYHTYNVWYTYDLKDDDGIWGWQSVFKFKIKLLNVGYTGLLTFNMDNTKNTGQDYPIQISGNTYAYFNIISRLTDSGGNPNYIFFKLYQIGTSCSECLPE